MVNTNIQSPIPLAGGKGEVYKNHSSYESGEFRELINCEFVGDVLVNRRPIQSVQQFGDPFTPLDNPIGFIGQVDNRVIALGSGDQFAYTQSGSGARHTLWDPNSLPVPAPIASSFHVIRGVFRYNNRYYWITWEWDSDLTTFGTHNICLYHVDAGAGGITGVAFGSLTRTVLFSSTEKGFVFRNWFIFKDRLWISTTKGLYFSKATDPLVFAVPDGGFFKIPDQIINFCLGFRDSIYILCEDSIHLLSYSGDPNNDATLKVISTTEGGSHGCVFEGYFYFVNLTGIYATNGRSIDLVKSGEEIDLIWRFPTLHVFGENIIILFRTPYNYLDVTEPSPDQNNPRYYAYLGYNGYEVGMKVLNMRTGSASSWSFSDQEDYVGPELIQDGTICDLLVTPNFDGENTLFLLSNSKNFITTGPDLGRGFVYFMGETRHNNFIPNGPVDVPLNWNGEFYLRKINIKINIVKFAPDGTNFLMKKFRFLELMGSTFAKDMDIYVGYDDVGVAPAGIQEYVGPIDISTTDQGSENSLEPPIRSIRVPLNQRARSLSIYITTKNPLVPLDNSPTVDDPYHFTFVLKYMRVLWSYTNRASPLKVSDAPNLR